MKTRRIVISTVLLVGGLLSIVQVMPKNPLLIGERLFPYGGWIQVILAMLYGGWLCYKTVSYTHLTLPTTSRV